jgi:hypothetical protein
MDEEAGPVVRPYALTGGRTRPAGDWFDLLALVCAARGVLADQADLEPEQVSILRRSQVPVSVADLAADLDLPLGVIKILVADLRERRLATVRGPAKATLTDAKILRDVAEGLRRI